MPEKSALNKISEFIEKLKAHGIGASLPVKRQYAYESDLDYKNDKLKLQVYFGKKGIKTVLQGNRESELYDKVSHILIEPGLFSAEKKIEIVEPAEYIGTDESGKGDYFGPLVVAAVYVDQKSLFSLRETGVRDSKLLSDFSISEVAGRIKSIIGSHYSVVVISPEKYNQLHSKMGNVNRLLGWAHARAIENVLSVIPASEVISDKFGDESLIINSLMEKGQKVNLIQRTKAERFAGVAAASILARDVFNNWFRNNKISGIELPKGASSRVDEAAKKLKAVIGDEDLKKYVKYHFKNTKKINE